ncbi:unnamed protein product [Phytomonas sp. EM1]|nr:unnamed protein product [Phytomonas sp. EM1]|eukprot:CCW60329.1 unnamed protein product [Phytomonas sp. isolate EM1]
MLQVPMSRVCRYSLSNPPPSKGPLNGNETIEEADLLDVQALQAEKAGDDPQCIQIMERSVQIRARVISQMSEQLQGSDVDMSVYTTYNNALSGLSAAAERLAIKCNTFAIQKFKQRDFNTAESLLKYILDLTSEQGSFLCQSDERRCYLRSVTLNNLGCMERRRGHYPEALKYLQESMEVVGSESPIPYISISAILLQLRQCEDAANMAQRAIDLMPDVPKDPSLIAVAHHNLAMALETISKDASFEEYEVAYKMASATLGKESPTTQLILANWQRFERIHCPETTLAGRSAVGQSSLSKSPMNGAQVNRPSSFRKREPIPNSKQDPHQVSGSNQVADIFPHPFFRSQYEIPGTSSFSRNNKSQPYFDSLQHFAHKPLFPHVKGDTAGSHGTERRPLPKYAPNLQKGAMETAANPHPAASDIASAVDKLPHTFPPNTERYTLKSLAQHGTDRGWVETLPPIAKPTPFLPNVPKHNTPRKTKPSSSKAIQLCKAVSPPHKAPATKEFTRTKTVTRKISPHKTEAAKEALRNSPPKPLHNALSSASDPTAPISFNRTDTSAVRGHPAHTAFVKVSTANTLTQSKSPGAMTSHSPKRAAQSSDCAVRQDAAEGIYATDTLITSPSFSRPSKDLVESMIDRLEMLLHDEEEMERKYTKALIIQKNYRRHLSQRRVLTMRVNMDFENRLRRIRENLAARTIQTAYRRTLGSRSVAHGCRRPPRRTTRGMINMAAVRIQSVARGWLARREYLRRQHYQRVCDSASTRIQNWFRCLRARQELQRLQIQRRFEEEPIFRLQRQDYAANIIQKVWRTHRQIRLSREELQQRRVRRLEEEMHLLSKAASRIQSVWRGFVCRRQVRTCMVIAKQREAERYEYQRLRNATIKIQSFCRGMLVRRQTSPFLDRARRRAAKAINLLSRAHAAAGVIQRAYRCHLGRRRLCLLKAEHNVLVRESQLLALASLVQRVGRGYLFRLNLSKEVSHFACEARRYHQQLSVLHQGVAHSESKFPTEVLHLLEQEEETQRSVIEIEERRAWRSVKHWGNTIPMDLSVLPMVRRNSGDLAEATDPKQDGPAEEVVREVCVYESEKLCTAKPKEESAAFIITRFMRRAASKRALARHVKAIQHLRVEEEDSVAEEDVTCRDTTFGDIPAIVKKPVMESSLTSVDNREAVAREQEELRKLEEMERVLEEADIFQRLLEAEAAICTAFPDEEEFCVDNGEEMPREPSETEELHIDGPSSEPDEGGTVSIVPEESQLKEFGDREVQTEEPIAQTSHTEVIDTTAIAECDAVEMHMSVFDSHTEPMLNALLDTAARILQQFFRFVVARKKLLRLQQMNRERLNIELAAEAFLNNASTVIQSVFRGHLARRRVRELYARQERYLRSLHDELTSENSDDNKVVLTDSKVNSKGKSFEDNVLFSNEVETQFKFPSCDQKNVSKESPPITAATLSVSIPFECRSVSRSTASVEEIESND